MAKKNRIKSQDRIQSGNKFAKQGNKSQTAANTGNNLKVKMELISDAIFGNGMSVPGGEDIAVQTDENGFPYLKGSTLKGIFREQLENHLAWIDYDTNIAGILLGNEGDDSDDARKLVFPDMRLPMSVTSRVLAEIGDDKDIVTDSMTNIRTFTAIDENGMTKEHSLRQARCVNKGLTFYGIIKCKPQDQGLVSEVLTEIKWVGSMRNRGFGKVKFSIEQ